MLPIPKPGSVAMQRNEEPHVPKTEAAQEKVLTDAPQTQGYRPQLQSYYQMYGDDGPTYWEVLRRVEAMARHPVLYVAMDYYLAPIHAAEFDIKASSSESGALGLEMIRKFWTRDLYLAQLCYEYGWEGYEVCYENRKNYMLYKGLLEFAPVDVTVLTREKKMIGVRVMNGDGEGSEINLWSSRKRLPAKGLWLTHKRKYHRWHGRSQYYAAYKPWFEVAARDGSEEITAMAIYRFGMSGPLVRYPQGSENAARTRPGDSRQDLRDIALMAGNQAKSGATIALSSAQEGGKYVWDFEWPKHGAEIQNLITFDEAWVKKMFFGMGVPPEIIQASDTGSGYSGRSVPKESFYVSQQHNAENLLQAFVEHVVNPCIKWNLGPEHWIEAKVKPLLKTQAQQSGGQEGQQPPGAPPGQPPPGAPQAAPPGRPAPGNPQSSVPDLGSMFGGGGAKPKMQKMSLDTGDVVWFPAVEELAEVRMLALPDHSVSLDINIAKPIHIVDEIAAEANRGYQRLVKRIQGEIVAAVQSRDAYVIVTKVSEILLKYQPHLARLLADTKIASALAGARDIIRNHPSDDLNKLPPSGISIIEQLLKGRPDAAIAAAKEVVDADTAEEAAVPWTPLDVGEPLPLTHFPMIDEAAKDLLERKAMVRPDFDALHHEAREGAFTVAGLATAAAVEKVRDAAAKAVALGQTLKQFGESVKAELGSNTFLSPAHGETVFRAAILGAYANGQDRLLDDPRVGNYFPYVTRYVTHDDRVRPEHLALAKCGIQGTNIYRRDDPTWIKFRAPFDYNCRCVDSFCTVQQAAAKGIVEAMEWQRTGEPPANPTYVDPPPFEPPPDWQRLSLESIGVKWLQAERDASGHFVNKGMGQSNSGPLVADVPKDDIKVDSGKPKDDQHKFSSCQFNLSDAEFHHDQPSPIPKLVELSSRIPATHLADRGREDTFHVTALYGIEDQNPVSVQNAVKDFGPVRCKLRTVSLFPANEQHKFEVVKVGVESEDLDRLNELLKTLPHTSAHPVFYPHVTIAYVRPGMGTELVGDTSLDGVQFICRYLIFSDRDGNKSRIDLVTGNLQKTGIEHSAAFLSLFGPSFARAAEPIVLTPVERVPPVPTLAEIGTLVRQEVRAAADEITGEVRKPRRITKKLTVDELRADGGVQAATVEVTEH